MRAMRLFTPAPAEDSPLELTHLPLPRPAPGQALLRVLLCGVCRTDLHLVEGEIHPPSLPVTPGHQVVAEVEALGEGVDCLEIGQRVGAAWLGWACGECAFCRGGRQNLCPRARFTGFHYDGGFGEYMLGEANFLLPLPGEISDLQAAPLLCAGIIGYRSLRLAELQPGERLGLFGFGASAHLAIQVARHWGCEVYVFTRSPEHRRHAEQLGAAWTGAAEDQPPQPLDRAVIFAPAGWLVPRALEKLRPGGTLAVNAIHLSPIPEMPYALIYGERTLRSVANATYQDGLDFIKLAVEIPLRASTALYPLEDANEALIDLKHSQLEGEAVLEVGASLSR
jgi:propanol-preferring alcohol dehydrogenase